MDVVHPRFLLYILQTTRKTRFGSCTRKKKNVQNHISVIFADFDGFAHIRIIYTWDEIIFLSVLYIVSHTFHETA